MVRYLGPKNRIARRFGANIFNRQRNPLAHKQNPPGQHGARKRKKSDYGQQLEEKQKLKAVFGMLTEKQLVRYYKESITLGGSTVTNLMRMLECRLDNVVYRLKFASTIFGAQQLVAHGHILVNGKKVDIRSFRVKPGMVISIKEKSRKVDVIQKSIEDTRRSVPEYMELDVANFSGKLLSLPEVDQISLPIAINIPIVCEFLAHSN
jgi:small subunit ribosomal protein S4